MYKRQSHVSTDSSSSDGDRLYRGPRQSAMAAPPALDHLSSGSDAAPAPPEAVAAATAARAAVDAELDAMLAVDVAPGEEVLPAPELDAMLAVDVAPAAPAQGAASAAQQQPEVAPDEEVLPAPESLQSEVRLASCVDIHDH